MNIKYEKFDYGIKFKSRWNGFGIENSLKRFITVRPVTLKAYSKMFKLITGGSKLSGYPVIGSLYK